MNTTQEVNHCRTGCGCLGQSLSEEHVGKQNTKTRSWIGFQHEDDGFTCFCSLLCAKWCEDSVVDGIVQEQHLGRFHKQMHQWKYIQIDDGVYAGCQEVVQRFHYRSEYIEGQDRQRCCKDTCCKVVHKHLETGFHFSFKQSV